MNELLPIEWIALVIAPAMALIAVYKSIPKQWFNVALAGEMTVSIPMVWLLIEYGVEGDPISLFNIGWSLLFCYIFYFIRGPILSSIYGAVVVYQGLVIFNPALDYSYESVMTMFIIIQLLFGFRSLKHGLDQQRDIDHLWSSINRRINR